MPSLFVFLNLSAHFMFLCPHKSATSEKNLIAVKEAITTAMENHDIDLKTKLSSFSLKDTNQSLKASQSKEKPKMPKIHQGMQCKVPTWPCC